MDDVKKMLRAIMNKQSSFSEELLKLREDMNNRFEKVELRFDKAEENALQVEKRLTARIDTLGLQIARLEDDTPTRAEHDVLEKRVTKLGKKLSS